MPKNDRPERADHAVRLKAFTELEQLRVALADRYGVPYPLIDTLDYAVRHALAWTVDPDAVMAVHCPKGLRQARGHTQRNDPDGKGRLRRHDNRSETHD